MRANFMPPDKQYEQNVQDPHMVAQCRSNPDVLWVQHHNGIFKSTTARNWTEITDISHRLSDSPSRRIRRTRHRLVRARHERRKALPVDGKVVVNRTRDGGKTFETSPAGCRRSTPTISSIATRSMSTIRAGR